MKKKVFIGIISLVFCACLYSCRHQTENDEQSESQNETPKVIKIEANKDTQIIQVPPLKTSDSQNDSSTQLKSNPQETTSVTQISPSPKNVPALKKTTDKVELQYEKVIFLMEILRSDCKTSQEIELSLGEIGTYRKMKFTWTDSSLAYRLINQEKEMKQLKIIEKKLEELLKNCEKKKETH